MLASHRVAGVEVRKLVCKRAERATETVVRGVVGGLLNAVALDDEGITVAVVGFVGGEVDFTEEFMLVVFKFADHYASEFLV